ncbi:MAG: lamin tail domain-containing protein [Flavobacteriales bacterium]|jgi:hypothetical protein|nr:lamin tail domain-containing protein [Flavobacteriales bacterium]
MKPTYRLVLLLSFLIPYSFFSQLSDDFSDGDYTNSPAWNGDLNKYEVNASNQLQSNGPSVSDTAYLSTNTGNLDFNATIVWEFYLEMGFNPSNSNNCRIYLASDNANLRSSLNGYYIRIGENGSSDAIKFYKQVGTTSTLLHTGTGNTFGTSPVASIRVTRTNNGNWTFESDATGGTSYIAEGSTTNTDITASQFFGVWSKYTSSNFDNFIYDNFSITGSTIVDNIPPVVSNVAIISNNQLDISFNEPLDPTTAQNTSNYSVNNGISNPSSATLDGSDPTLVHLNFGSNFTDGQTNTITIQNVQDLANNTMNASQHDFLYFVAVTASYKDLVINEIFADPSPQYGLPSGEFIEIYNASSHIFNLSNWTIGDASSDEQLGNYTLLPNEYVIIADDAYSFEYSIFPNSIIVSSLPSYNNSTDDVVLKDQNGNVVDFVTYSEEWYGSSLKEDGGYTLELINPTLPCTSSSNWIGSNNPNGGTPGTQNSVFNVTPDATTPSIINASTQNNATITLCFSETLDTTGVSISNFSIDNGINIIAYSFDEFFSCVELITNPSLDTGTVYTITVNGLSDCSGNATTNEQAEIILPHAGAKGDLIINEILYNPHPDGVDFVELYNNSEKNIDLFNWQLAKIAGDTISSKKLIESHFLLKPQEYVVLTTAPDNIIEHYPNAQPDRFIDMSSFPSYADDEGTVILFLPNNQVVDSVHYDDSFQFALLKETDGVSLERIDFNRSSNDETNWHSAAEAEGFGTPTLQNSQYTTTETSPSTLTVEPELFSPDNDGFEDVLTLSYKMENPGFVGNITIFDTQGRTVRQLMQNELLGIEGAISWDGLNNQREKARIGAYIIYFEYFDLDGNVHAIKHPCVVGGKF